MIPYGRLLHNYLVMLKLRGIKTTDVSEYLANNLAEVRGHLSSNWQGRYRVREFPDFRDDLLWDRVRQLPLSFKEFAGADFQKELDKYRLDYILSKGHLPDDILKELPGTEVFFKSDNDIVVYSFKRD